jgi:hypothetical protein
MVVGIVMIPVGPSKIRVVKPKDPIGVIGWVIVGIVVIGTDISPPLRPEIKEFRGQDGILIVGLPDAERFSPHDLPHHGHKPP